MVAQLDGIPYAALPSAAKAAAALAWPPRLVVIHDTSNDATAAQEAAYAARRPIDGATSAHFYVDTSGPLGSVPLNRQAWAAYAYANSHGWHIEMCGYNVGTRGAVPAATIALTAGLVRRLCELADIPMVKLSPAEVAAGKRGICGHWDITTGLKVGDHDDPGRAFDWPAFIAVVKEDDMLTDADIERIAAACAKATWGYNFGSRTTVVTALARLNAVLAAALDDGDTTVVLPPDAIADLTELKDAIAALPKAVVDAEAARLAS